MKSILDTLYKVFNFTKKDKSIYKKFVEEYKVNGLSDEDSVLFANIIFLLTNKSIIDHLLARLESEVKKLWENEAANPAMILELHNPVEYIQLFGLNWPVPEPYLAGNHSQHLLSRALLQMEQRHGVNATYAKDAPVPTFLGVITPEDAETILVKRRRIWNDDPRMSGIFFHGKMMHRIQFYLIMKAMDLGMLDTGSLSILDIIKKLITTKVTAYEPFYNMAWNFLIDFNISDVNFTEADRRNLSPLAEYFPPVINEGSYDKPYLFGCDPYFLHSYIMSVTRSDTPYLSECVTQMFCKSALAIQDIEKKIGIKVDYAGYLDNKETEVPQTVQSKISGSDLEIKKVLSRQAQTFATYGVHPVSFKDIIERQNETGKNGRVDRKRSVASSETGFIQYRKMFTSDKAGDLSAMPDTNTRPSKLIK